MINTEKRNNLTNSTSTIATGMLTDTVKALPIPSILNAIDHSLIMFSETIDELEARLNSMLRSPAITCEALTDKEPNGDSAMTNRLKGVCDDIQANKRRVDELIRLLDI